MVVGGGEGGGLSWADFHIFWITWVCMNGLWDKPSDTSTYKHTPEMTGASYSGYKFVPNDLCNLFSTLP